MVWASTYVLHPMIRRAFLRRMAHAAMAGMLGVELLARAPEVDDDVYGMSMMEACGPYQLERNRQLATRLEYFALGDHVPPTGTIVAIDYRDSTITIDWT